MNNISHKNRTSRLFLLFIIGCVVLASGAFWIYSQFYISTDDAYVNANVVQISPRVTGQVVQVAIRNNQLVEAGDVLFVLDPAIYQAALSNAEAAADRASAERRIARITADRIQTLVKKHAASSHEGDIARARLQSAEAGVVMAEAAVKTARLHLQYTRILAPVSGWVTRLSLRVGHIVTANQPLFALVSQGEFWVDANFRETDLEAIREGQPAEIRIDMYPGHRFHGVVESISSGTGAAFSLLPPENATGNWVKVTQRIPVRIKITDPESRFPLRIGASAKVSISLYHWKNP